MKKLFTSIFIFLSTILFIHGQNPSAIFDLESTEQGVLIPRMTTQQRSDILQPATSLLVYDTDTDSYWYYHDNEWHQIAESASGSETKANNEGQFFEFELTDELYLSMPGQIDEETQITVCLDITHSDIGYLDIGLVQNGTYIPLTVGAGGNGDNMRGTCFSNAAINYFSEVSPADAPFTGYYQPAGSFNDLIGNDIAGPWQLLIYVTEEFAWNGTLDSWKVIVSKSGEPTIANLLADGNQDTKIQVEESINENKIRFDVAGEERMILDNNGKLGIGTSEPQAPLHIMNNDVAKIQLNRNGAATILEHNSNGGTLKLGRPAGDFGVEFKTDGDSYISGGSLGIGTSQPLERLHIFSSKPRILLTPRDNFPDRSEIFFAEDEAGKYGMRFNYNGVFDRLELWGFNNVDRSTQEAGTAGSHLMSIQRDNGLTTHHALNDYGHVMVIENQSDQPEADGLEIKLGVHPLILDQRNHFITFTDQLGTAGRIEGKVSVTILARQVVNDLLGTTPTVPNVAAGDLNSSAYASEDRNQNPPNFYSQTEDDATFADLLDSEYGLALLEYTVDLVESIIVFSVNIYGAAAGLAVFGDIDDVVWSGTDVVVNSLKLGAYFIYEELSKGIAFESGGADYAEWLEHADPREKFLPGEIVGVKGGLISKHFENPDQYMVISTNPIVIGNMPDSTGKHSQVAFIGQAPARIIGPVSVGDYILPSGKQDGYGIAVHPDQMRVGDYERIVGVSWSEGDSTQMINVANLAIGINSNDLVGTVSEMQMQINRMQKAIQQINPDFSLALYPEGEVREADISQTRTSISLQDKVLENVNQSPGHTIQSAMEEIKTALLNQKVDLSLLPHLQDLLDNPTAENAQRTSDYYQKVLDRCSGLLANSN
ncbi:MAG: hypothetical protein KDC80_19645 [Saprospiraceae bacterium]|nr:hypothetical protein [Saprospiraceae bacterium]